MTQKSSLDNSPLPQKMLLPLNEIVDLYEQINKDLAKDT